MNKLTKNKKTVVLCVLDGWGLNTQIEFNAIKQASTPNFDFLENNFPSSKLRADGEYVGLSAGQIGNSEVGHMTIGAGRAVPMNLPRINKLVKSNILKNNLVIKRFITALKTSGGVAHLVGLFSDGGVHAHQDHLVHLANLLSDEDIKVNLHLFLDGRDVLPKAAVNDLRLLESKLNEGVQVATMVGRFYAMDRDNRWDRIEKAYNLLVSGIGENYESPEEAILSRYKRGETDEFIQPIIFNNYSGFSKEGDGLFCTNFRADRARELLSALCDPHFISFPRDKNFSFVTQSGFIDYSVHHIKFMDTVLKNQSVKNTLGECLSNAKKTQFRLAETEKYPHVTFFFNSGVESQSSGESWFMVPSPKVATYDLSPEMSAKEVTEKLVESIRSNQFDFILVNYANPDMVGHSGKLDAAVKACESVDVYLGELYRELTDLGGILLLTSDHGNCELMYDATNNSPHTSHTLNLVPFIVVGLPDSVEVMNGALSDIAPTVLDILKIKVPHEMTGRSLLRT